MTRFCRLAFAFVAFAGLCMPLHGCAFLDDFSKFKANQAEKDSGASDDAGGGAAGAKADSGADAAMANPCAGVSCTKLDGPCSKGVCKAGKCSAMAIHEGDACTGDKCSDNGVCSAGVCKGTAKDCTGMDTACRKGVCDPQTGACGYTNINENVACDDGDLCTTGDACASGDCTGAAVDCRGLDGECLVGTCDSSTGDCTAMVAADDTVCGASGTCKAYACSSGVCTGTGNKPANATCDDYNDCTKGGTGASSDHCDGAGNCVGGAPVAAGTACDDNNECTGDGGTDQCDGAGTCSGTPVADGTACERACRTASTCSMGKCVDAAGTSSYMPRCEYNWCGNEKLCDLSYQGDGTCDCGCNGLQFRNHAGLLVTFDDSADCNDCSAPMCTSKTVTDPNDPNHTTAHDASKQCDTSTGMAVTDCPTSYQGDGQCDCGCQFADPDCSGGDCCNDLSTTAKPFGCTNAFVQECVCARTPHGDPFCCNREPNVTGVWDATCAAEAVAFGCAICP